MRSLGLLLTITIGLALVSVTRADESWVDKTIIVKRLNVKLHETDPVTGLKLPSGELRYRAYTVRHEAGGFLRLRQDGKDVWIQKNDAILIDRAINYFDDEIRARPNDDVSLGIRGFVHVRSGNAEAAIKDLSEAIRINPKRCIWWAIRGAGLGREE